MCGNNELHCQYREWVAKSAEQPPSLFSARASSVMLSQVKRGHLPFAIRFLRISFYQFCFSHGFRCLRSFTLTFFDAVSHARTCAPSLGFPLFCFHNLHTRPVSNSKNRVAVVTWNQCWKSRDCASFQGEICEVVKICPKSACCDLIQRALCGNLWRLWKQKGINCSGARVRARARREDCNTF